MAVREVRMCDAVTAPASGNPAGVAVRGDTGGYHDEARGGPDSVPCNRTAVKTCAICREDCCASHLGDTKIRSNVVLTGTNLPNGGQYVLGAQPIELHVCVFCTKDILSAMNKREHTIRHVIKTDPEEILSAIRARLTEKSLSGVVLKS
jgi:hypothetical protein